MKEEGCLKKCSKLIVQISLLGINFIATKQAWPFEIVQAFLTTELTPQLTFASKDN
jgi:hypothetical protein